MPNIIIKNGLYGEKTKDEWEAHFNIRITDPDGWIATGTPGGGFLITEATFIKLALMSTIESQSGDLSFFRYARKLEENGGLFVR